MKIEKVSFAEDPESITKEDFDCVWVQLKPRSRPSPLLSQPLQWLDWKLQGQISRFLLQIEPKGTNHAATTFMPTMKKVSSPFLALQTEVSVDWSAFIRNCKGMKMKRVLFFLEQTSGLEAVERELRKVTGTSFPERVALACSAGSEQPSAGNG